MIVGLLATILLAPWFLVLCWVYWRFGRAAKRSRGFDLAAMVMAIVLAAGSGWYGLGVADVAYGKLWPQILASLLAYGVFLLVLLIAAWWRRRTGNQT